MIVVDQREKLPFDFSRTGTRQLTRYLPSGDYSILGYENEIAIERKRPAELFGNFTTHRDRFQREFERLAQFRYAAVVIEGNMAECAVVPSQYSRVSPHLVINSLIAWSLQYGVHPWFAGSRELAEALTYRLLEKFFAYRLNDFS